MVIGGHPRIFTRIFALAKCGTFCCQSKVCENASENARMTTDDHKQNLLPNRDLWKIISHDWNMISTQIFQRCLTLMQTSICANKNMRSRGAYKNPLKEIEQFTFWVTEKCAFLGLAFFWHLTEKFRWWIFVRLVESFHLHPYMQHFEGHWKIYA